MPQGGIGVQIQREAVRIRYCSIVYRGEVNVAKKQWLQQLQHRITSSYKSWSGLCPL